MNVKTAVESTLPKDEPRDESASQTAPSLPASGLVTPTGPSEPDGTPIKAPQPEGEPDPVYIGPDGDLGYGFKADGTPRTNNRGRRPADPGVAQEKAKQHARLKSVTPSTHKAPKTVANVTVLAVVNYQALGETAASIWFNVPAMVLGSDWLPSEREGEPAAVAGMFRDYFKSTNVRDIPPGFALALGLTVYALKRAQKPTVADKLKGFGGWVKGMTGKIRIR